MIIYRVYTAFHEASESGTHEYGYFSNFDAAKKRAREVFAKNCQEEPIESDNGSLSYYDGWYSYSVNIERILVDKEMNETNVGYT